MQSLPIFTKCHFCHKSLMDEQHRLDDLPSIRLKAVHGDRKGFIYLSSLYGSYAKQFEDLPDEAHGIYEFYCPFCNNPLEVVGLCDCKAPLVSMLMQHGGRIKFCSRNGCQRHSLEFEDINDAFQLLINHDKTALG